MQVDLAGELHAAPANTAPLRLRGFLIVRAHRRAEREPQLDGVSSGRVSEYVGTGIFARVQPYPLPRIQRSSLSSTIRRGVA
jgi:hypothetical protein